MTHYIITVVLLICTVCLALLAFDHRALIQKLSSHNSSLISSNRELKAHLEKLKTLSDEQDASLATFKASVDKEKKAVQQLVQAQKDYIAALEVNLQHYEKSFTPTTLAPLRR